MTKPSTKSPPKNKALERAEAEFDARRAAIESDEYLSRSEKRDGLLAAAAELEWTTRRIAQGG
jgi:hypothetical protein